MRIITPIWVKGGQGDYIASRSGLNYAPIVRSIFLDQNGAIYRNDSSSYINDGSNAGLRTDSWYACRAIYVTLIADTLV